MPSLLRLLIADEDPAVRQTLIEAVRDLEDRVVVTPAASPAEMEETVTQERPDLVYIGMTQPGSVWTQALQRLQVQGWFAGAVVVADAGRSPIRLRHIAEGIVASWECEAAPPPRHADRLAIPAAGRIVIVRVDDLCWIEGAGTYLRLHGGGKTHLLRESMQGITERLDPKRFVRIHRSAIVNVDCVQSLEHEARGEYRVHLADGTELKLTRSYRHHLPALTGGGGL